MAKSKRAFMRVDFCSKMCNFVKITGKCVSVTCNGYNEDSCIFSLSVNTILTPWLTLMCKLWWNLYNQNASWFYITMTQIFVYLPWGPAATCTKKIDSNDKNFSLQRKAMVEVPCWMSQWGCLSRGCDAKLKGCKIRNVTPCLKPRQQTLNYAGLCGKTHITKPVWVSTIGRFYINLSFQFLSKTT